MTKEYKETESSLCIIN